MHGVGDLVQCPIPHQMLWSEQGERLLRTLPVVQEWHLAVVSVSLMQGCYRDLNLEAATWEPVTLIRYRFSLERDFPARAFKAAFISTTP